MTIHRSTLLGLAFLAVASPVLPAAAQGFSPIAISLPSDGTPQSVQLPAGEYAVEVVGGGWNPFKDAPPGKWESRFEYSTATQTAMWSGGAYATAGHAVAAAPILGLSLTIDQHVSFRIQDSNYADNSGSLTLRISQPLSLKNASRENLERLFQALAQLDPQAFPQILQKWIETGDWVSFIGGLGERLESVGSAIGRAGGVIANLPLQLITQDLQTQVEIATAAGALYAAKNEVDPTFKQIVTPNKRQLLKCSMQSEFDPANDDCGRKLPVSTGANGAKRMNGPAGGLPTVYDPPMAHGFEYEAAPTDPGFIAIIPPIVAAIGIEEYAIQTNTNGCWTEIGRAAPLREFYFPSPVRRFRIMGVDRNAVLNDATDNSWVAALVFERDGRFTGFVRPITDDASAQPRPCPGFSLINPGTGHRYEIVKGNRIDAETAGLLSDGHLVEINDSAEQQWLIESFDMEYPQTLGSVETKAGYWIGLQDVEQEGVYLWLGGQSLLNTGFGAVLGATPWSQGQPDNYLGSEDYIGMNFRPCDFGPCGITTGAEEPGQWNDYATVDALNYGIIEYPRAQFRVDPRAAYLRASADDQPENPLIIDLASRGVLPGDLVRIWRSGDFAPGTVGTLTQDTQIQLGVVFSSSAVLRDRDVLNRIADAIDAGPELVSPVTFRGGLPTDIPEDFPVPRDITITVPPAASHLFVAPISSFFGDNNDPDGDLGVNIRVFTGVAAGKNLVIGFNPTIGTGTILDQNVRIGSFANIGDNVQIKQGTRLGSSVIIGDWSELNSGVVGGNNVTIGENVVIERNVIVQNGVVIGDAAHIGQASVVCAGAQIGAGAELGQNTLVMPGVVVPAGAVLAGSRTAVTTAMCTG